MKPIAEQSDKKAAFTIIELLTVMSVIIILIGLLVPGLNALRRYARKVAQKNQFHAIDVGLETFNAEWGDYPNSDAQANYCGAIRLTEAMVGADLLGYAPPGSDPCDLSNRKTYLPVERANAYKLGDLYYDPVTELPNTGSLNADSFVLCDEYRRVEHRTGALVGMPILYFRANASNPGFTIYNYHNNKVLIDLGKPWDPGGTEHKLKMFTLFYIKIRNEQITTTYRPKRADSFILLSAGYDGEYGTDDDIFNF